MKFKIFSIPVTISYTYICIIAVCIITNQFTSFLYCILAVIIHETGHLLPMKHFRCLPDKIKISLFEISISGSLRQQKSLKENFIIIFFGPFVNFICFILLYLLYLICSDIFQPPAYANLCVGLFNILPVMSLDGGQLLYLALRCRLSDKSAERCVNVITFIVLFPLAALGFLVLFNSKYNFSLLFVCIYIIFSLVFRNNKFY